MNVRLGALGTVPEFGRPLRLLDNGADVFGRSRGPRCREPRFRLAT